MCNFFAQFLVMESTNIYTQFFVFFFFLQSVALFVCLGCINFRMRKISGNVVWTRPMSLSRAAKLLSRFSSVDNGSSAAVSMYLQRASEAFDHLVQFHSKRMKVEENPDSLRAAIPPIDKKPRAADVEDEVVQIASKIDHEHEHEQEQNQRKKKKNKRRRDKEVDSNRKKRRIEAVDS